MQLLTASRIKMTFSWNVDFISTAGDTNGQLDIDLRSPTALLTVNMTAKDKEGLMVGGYVGGS